MTEIENMSSGDIIRWAMHKFTGKPIYTLYICLFKREISISFDRNPTGRLFKVKLMKFPKRKEECL